MFCDVTLGCPDADENCIGVYGRSATGEFKTPATWRIDLLFYLYVFQMKC